MGELISMAERKKRLFPALRKLGLKDVYFCMAKGCDSDRFHFSSEGVVMCARCGATMENLKVVDSEKK